MAKKVLCDGCSGLCCQYFALPIETPEDKGDYDDIRWYLCHKGIEIFVEDGDWYIKIKNKCKHFSEKSNRCRIYTKRPRICRQYSSKGCDYIEGEYDYKLYLTSDKQIEEHIKTKFNDKKANNHKIRRTNKNK